jgi:hypothetical protein
MQLQAGDTGTYLFLDKLILKVCSVSVAKQHKQNI